MNQSLPIPNAYTLGLVSKNLGLPLLAEGMRDSAGAFNRAIGILDALAPIPVAQNIGHNEPSDISGVAEGEVYFVDSSEDEDWDNKLDCLAVYLGAEWAFLGSARSMLCVPLNDGASALTPIRPRQRTAATSSTWSVF